jgi:NAD(P)-dependent dehydrogenase (short-subunit alcohol dehydrogenase family)
MTNLFDLTGRVALVTGASSGLGRRFAHTLAKAGAAVALCARRVDRLDQVASEIAAVGGRALSVALDVTDPASISAALERAAAELGPVTILVNNAGIAATRALLDQSDAEWASVLETNLTGAMRVARAMARHIGLHGRGGVIMNVASIAGLRAAAQVAAYSASKAALISLTQSMALEFARFGIRVNALAPGYIETDLNREFLNSPVAQPILKRVPLRRFGEPGDLDGALLLLVSDAGRYMTGSVVVVDGGHSVSFP